jgi:hypothetical protein
VEVYESQVYSQKPTLELVIKPNGLYKRVKLMTSVTRKSAGYEVPPTRNKKHRLGSRPIWKCQNATRYMIWLRRSCPMVCCHIHATLLTIRSHLGGSSERFGWWLFLNIGNASFFKNICGTKFHPHDFWQNPITGMRVVYRIMWNTQLRNHVFFGSRG